MGMGKAHHGRIVPIAILLSGTLAGSVAAVEMTADRCDSGDAAVRMEVSVEGIRNAKGTISIAVYGDRPEDFLAAGKKLRKLRLPAQGGTVHGCLLLPRLGTYAFTAYHDEDGDHHFTKNFLGLPTEGFAVSNGSNSLLAIPDFKDAAVTVNHTASQVVLKMHYP